MNGNAANIAQGAAAWPDVSLAGWAPTKQTVHLYSQMLGKLRVALSPTQPNWVFAALHLTARGFTTGPMPYRGTSIDATLDVYASELIINRSDGRTYRIAILPVRTIADVFAELRSALKALGVDCRINPVPQELADTTPFDEDRRPAVYEPGAVQRWFHAATATAATFDAWRAHFFGRSAIALWWGAFDVGLTLFNGKHCAPPADRGFLLKYDLDAEMMNAGLYCGDEQTAPFFYAYIYPQPPRAEALKIAPVAASWSANLREWVLPYDAVRSAADPAAELRAFLDSIYEQCVTAAGWDRDALSYIAPKRSARP